MTRHGDIFWLEFANGKKTLIFYYTNVNKTNFFSIKLFEQSQTLICTKEHTNFGSAK